MLLCFNYKSFTNASESHGQQNSIWNKKSVQTSIPRSKLSPWPHKREKFQPTSVHLLNLPACSWTSPLPPLYTGTNAVALAPQLTRRQRMSTQISTFHLSCIQISLGWVSMGVAAHWQTCHKITFRKKTHKEFIQIALMEKNASIQRLAWCDSV